MTSKFTTRESFATSRLLMYALAGSRRIGAALRSAKVAARRARKARR